MPIKMNRDPVLAAHLRDLRDQSGMSQESFWKMFNVPHSTGWRYENAERTVPNTLLQLIELKFGDKKLSRPKEEQGFSVEVLAALDLIRSNEVAWKYVKQLAKKES